MEINRSYFDRSIELEEMGKPFVTVSITGLRGSAPQDIGAKMIAKSDGLDFGTVGGGKVEAHCINYSKKLLADDKVSAISHTWNLQKDIGMTCGGEVSFFFEVMRPKPLWSIVVFGAGHISQELTQLLLRLDCDLTVIDNRVEWLDKIKDNKNLTKIHAKEMSEALVNISDDSYIALMTMGHAYDVPILHKALNERSFPYLAVIGSQSKRNRMEAELKELGLNEDKINSFICPIGEKIGSNHPGEIAISIAAQLLRHRDK